MFKKIDNTKKQRRALRTHLEKLSLGNDFPSYEYLDTDIPGKFAKLYALELADFLGRSLLCVMILNSLKDFIVLVVKLFR